MKKYRTILIDPPWPQGKTGLRSVRPNQSIKLDYLTMSIEEIMALPISHLLETECLIFLWTTDRFMEEAHKILRNWGFKKHCIFVWNKPTGVCPFSVQFRNEYMLMGYIMKLKLKKIGLPTNFNGRSYKHSQKPEESYRLIEQIGYEPRIELFVRKKREGWDVVGNEIDGKNILTSLKELCKN